MTIDMTFERRLELSGQVRYEEGMSQGTRNTLKILIMNNALQLPESVDIDSMTDEEVVRLSESLGTH